jgi:porin
MQSVYSNAGWRATNLYWRQVIGGQDKLVLYGGFVDVTDWTDVYVVASPWQSFNNLVFATGSGAMGGLYPDGSMGFMVNSWLTDKIYAVASIIDTNGDASEFWDGFSTFFGDFETLKTIELGFTPGGINSVFFKNAHITFWQVDERTESQTPNGWGIIGSWSWLFGKTLPYFRFGWAKDGIAFYEYSISTGFAYNITGASNLGLGLNWNRPNANTFGEDLDNQFTSELFYKWHLTHHSEITPNIQLIKNPALNPSANWVGVFGLRGRFFL